MSGGIYQIVNSENGHIYFGSTIDLANRWLRHRMSLNKGDHCNRHLQRAWHKYGSVVFKFQILCVLERSQLHDTEDRLLSQTVGQPWCYNTSRYAMTHMLGRKHSSASIKKMMLRRWTPEARRKQSQEWTGRKHSKAARRRMSLAAIARWASPDARREMSLAITGKKDSVATRKRKSQAAKRQWASPIMRKNMMLARGIA